MEIRNSKDMIKKYIIYSFFVLAFLERTLFDLGPNIELITLALVVSTFYINKKTAFILTLATIALSDIILGNTNIFIFTWTGFLIPIVFLNVFKKLKASVFLGTLTGVSANIFFFIWTNFGVWALDSWGMYPNTLQGLVQSYINGLPFLRYQLISTLIFVPLGLLLLDTQLQKIFNRVKLLFRTTNFAIPRVSSH